MATRGSNAVQMARRRHRRTPARLKLPTITAIARGINLFPEDWAGNCYAVACAIVKAGLIPGRAVYGHYYGPVSRQSIFEADSPFQRHGWILVDPRTVAIVDPTRWAFEATRPYLYTSTGPNPEYDEGGQRVRVLQRAALPAPVGPLKSLTLPAAIVEQLQLPPQLAANQIFWLANLPYDDFGAHAPAVYAAIDQAGFRAAVPIDHILKAEATGG